MQRETGTKERDRDRQRGTGLMHGVLTVYGKRDTEGEVYREGYSERGTEGQTKQDSQGIDTDRESERQRQRTTMKKRWTESGRASERDKEG